MDYFEKLKEANELTLKYHGNVVSFERALFLSWYCGIADCKFCYMSSIKEKIDKNKAIRNIYRVLAEAILCKRIGWKIEFLTSGYNAFTHKEIDEISQMVSYVVGEPVWLNVGVLKNLDFGSYVEGIVGAVETFDFELRKNICPSKNLEEIIKMLKEAKSVGFKTGITIILGLGEDKTKLENLFKLVKELKLDKIIFYTLIPHKGTIFENNVSPSTIYVSEIIAETRIRFPKIKITVGPWIDNISSIGLFLLSGANALTKFPLFKIFGTKVAKRIEQEILYVGRIPSGTVTDFKRLLSTYDYTKETKIEIDKKIIERIIEKRLRIEQFIMEYIDMIKKSVSKDTERNRYHFYY